MQPEITDFCLTYGDQAQDDTAFNVTNFAITTETTTKSRHIQAEAEHFNAVNFLS
jgi:trehalose-6-phosphatase